MIKVTKKLVSNNEALNSATSHKMANYKCIMYIMLSLMLLQFFTGCAIIRGGSEAALAIFLEKPSMELVLDRLNTAACSAMTAKAVINDIPISKDSKWPEQMESFPKEQLSEIIKVLGIDRAYVDNGGFVSPIKAHLVQVQTILYDVPPDLYAKNGSCYKIGEETFINGYYFKILNRGKIIKKSTPSQTEIENALGNAVKQFLDFGKANCAHRTFYKRKGKYKASLVNAAALNNGHKNISTALISVLEQYNAGDISDLKSSLAEIKDIKNDIIAINNEIMSLENKKTRLKRKEKVPGYASIDKVDSELSVKQKELDDKKERTSELQLMVDKSFDNIKNDLPIVSENDLKMLEKISAACKAVNGLLIDSFVLTTIAAYKTVSSVSGIGDEMKRMKAQAPKNPFIPLRLARLKSNAGNVLGNIKTIVYILKNERRMVSLIKSTSDKVIKVTRKSIESKKSKETASIAPKVKAVDESTVLADAEGTTDAKPITLELR